MRDLVVAAKRCNDCGEIKDLSCFYPRRKSEGGVQSYCKVCNRVRARKYWGKHRARLMEKQRTWKAANGSRIREYAWNYRMRSPEAGLRGNLKHSHGMSLQQYKRMLLEQGCRCAICSASAPIKKRLFVDHDHATGKIRSLLCRGCNTMLGMAKDRADILVAGASYLRNHNGDAR